MTGVQGESHRQDREVGQVWRWRQRLELYCCGPSDAYNYKNLEGTRKNPPLEISEGVWLCQHLAFRLLASRTVRE